MGKWYTGTFALCSSEFDSRRVQMDKKRVGNLGERIAVSYLIKKGYKILDKNYSPNFISGPQRGEIDIVAKKGDIISFVEVKALTKADRGRASVIAPEDKVDFSKQRKIIKTAESWLMEKKIPFDSKWQVDVLSIKINLAAKRAKINYFFNVSSA